MICEHFISSEDIYNEIYLKPLTWGPRFVAPGSSIAPLPDIFAALIAGPNPGRVGGEAGDEVVGGLVGDGHQVPATSGRLPRTEVSSIGPQLLQRIVLVASSSRRKQRPSSRAG